MQFYTFCHRVEANVCSDMKGVNFAKITTSLNNWLDAFTNLHIFWADLGKLSDKTREKLLMNDNMSSSTQ